MMKFFFIREEVIPIAIEFRQSAPIPKEDMQVPRGVTWYERLMALPNRVFGEQVLVAAGMSDKWLEEARMCLFCSSTEKVALYQSAFPAFSGLMGVSPLRSGEEYWFEQIKPNFIFAAAPPVATEGARIPKPSTLAPFTQKRSNHLLGVCWWCSCGR
ncbi:hypothetical protein HanRHA438_Chr08g0331321 [Helianthus annuus]|nr:hypothetical protein HanOQP8_Chr08g0270971 [Helianthus annuus]KAJ0896168.1 hypothetical protein HanRHA438_Chr08g0331321 [Helianthus annuus]KAJ0900175.1 hypothetical protein HanPSC8_Chr08g0310441 [Helianthus annuus]